MKKEDPVFCALLFHYVRMSSLEEKDLKFHPNWNSLFNGHPSYIYIVMRRQNFTFLVNSGFLLKPEK